MATNAQIHANHQNSLHSTGPITEAGKAASAQNAVKHGLSISDHSLTHKHSAQIQALTADFERQFPAPGSLASHLRTTLACATVRQNLLETAFLSLLDESDFDDPKLARVERYRAAAERSFYKALKELQALVQNEAIPAPKPAPKPISDPLAAGPKLTMENLRAAFPKEDRNKLARLLVAVRKDGY